MQQVKVGIIGCGNIAPAYVRGCRHFEILDVVACADVEQARAKALAAEFDIRAQSIEQLLDDPSVQIVINLTPPTAHAGVSKTIAAAGKHIYSEKPLAIERDSGHDILVAAEQHGVRVGCAPDTFLGGGMQTCRHLLDSGAIGEPVAATAFMLGRGMESWHPNPDFFYSAGGGPMFDMGPYYLTALINLLGPIEQVSSFARISFKERLITSKPRHGERIAVTTPTHVAGLIEFSAGPVGTIITSFDVWHHTLPRIEVYGSEGTLVVPDPNRFGGPVRLRRAQDSEWQEVELTHSDQVSRGIGVADLAYAISSGRKHRAGGAMAFHVLETMQAFLDSAESGQHVSIESDCERPAPLPLNLKEGQLDA